MRDWRILIVEDDFIIQVFIERILMACGYTVLGTASSGHEALAKIGCLNPDIVLLDIGIRGDIDGVEAAELINEKFHLPVVFLTGNSDEATMSRALKTKPLGIIFKPIDEEKLKREFGKLLENIE